MERIWEIVKEVYDTEEPPIRLKARIVDYLKLRSLSLDADFYVAKKIGGCIINYLIRENNKYNFELLYSQLIQE